MRAQMKKRRMAPDERREQLLDIAIELFANKGIGETKHADVAAAAGVSVATTFVYFPTRNDFVHDVLGHLRDELLTLLDWSPYEGLPVHEILSRMAWRLLERVETHPSYMRMMLVWGTQFSPDIRQKYLDHLEIYLDQLMLLLNEKAAHHPKSGNPLERPVGRDDARILNSATNALVQMKLDGESDEKLARFIDHTIAVVLAYRAESNKAG